MRRSSCVVAALVLALAPAACGKPQDGGGGGTRTPASRAAIVYLIDNPGGGCKVVKADNVARRGDTFEWRVYSTCQSANGKTVSLQFANNVSPAQPNTEHFQAKIGEGGPGYARLWFTVDKNPTGGSVCNGDGLCYHYEFYLDGAQLTDPIFEVDP